MKCEIRIVSGARAGQHDVFDKSYIGIGRHPLSDVRFDAEKDLDASTRHAAIVRTGDSYLLRDLGSRNGTFVNGEKIEGDRTLVDGDKLRFGVHGPEVEFNVQREQEEVIMAAVHAPAPAPRETRDPAVAPPPPPPASHSPATDAPQGAAPPSGPSKTSVLRAEVRAQALRVRAMTIVLFIVMVGAAAILLWQGRTAQQQMAASDTTISALRGQIQTLLTAKADADSLVARLRRDLGRETDPSRRRVLQQRFDSARTRQTNITAAQGVDYNAIMRANQSAIAVIYVRFADTMQMDQGTAFSVSTSGVMITNRHVVMNEAGERPRDIAIQFSGSAEVLPARLVRVAPDADLAVIQLESRGPFPAVAGLADGAGDVAEGAPVALVGFPGGGGEPGAVPRAKLVTGSVSRVLPDSMLELDAYSGQGASGSPIFDRNGRVIGVEFGGIGGRIIRGLPIRRARPLLPS
ncbi:MAG: trypsin-like peptidase domain-containing protein [Gemmatimonadales bacterium]|nr:trypsin-like peptidase domain-containing protein [Gemmatimonadales bacterium]